MYMCEILVHHLEIFNISVWKRDHTKYDPIFLIFIAIFFAKYFQGQCLEKYGFYICTKNYGQKYSTSITTLLPQHCKHFSLFGVTLL